MAERDAREVLEIYQAGIDTGNATFETTVPAWQIWDAGHLPEHRFVAVTPETGAVLGWVALSAVSDRCVYAGVKELSVYVSPGGRGHGVGSALLARLIASAEAGGVWTLQTGIFPENVASLALHEKAGFRVVGRRERIGRHHGAWRDVLFLERRSPVIG